MGRPHHSVLLTERSRIRFVFDQMCDQSHHNICDYHWAYVRCGSDSQDRRDRLDHQQRGCAHTRIEVDIRVGPVRPYDSFNQLHKYNGGKKDQHGRREPRVRRDNDANEAYAERLKRYLGVPTHRAFSKKAPKNKKELFKKKKETLRLRLPPLDPCTDIAFRVT